MKLDKTRLLQLMLFVLSNPFWFLMPLKVGVYFHIAAPKQPSFQMWWGLNSPVDTGNWDLCIRLFMQDINRKLPSVPVKFLFVSPELSMAFSHHTYIACIPQYGMCVRTNASSTVQLSQLEPVLIFQHICWYETKTETSCSLNITGSSLEPWEETLPYVSIGTGLSLTRLDGRKKVFLRW